MRDRRAAVLWCAIPVLLYLLALRHLWFDAPIQDDYDAILNSATVMRDAPSPRQWLHMFFAQHNEHRISVVRVLAWGMAEAFGRIDFRALMLLGNLALVGILALAWKEFREEVAAPLFAAAAFLLLQGTYYQAALMAMTALSNIGVVFFSFTCLYFAVRAGKAAALLAAAFGVLAAVTQANGLFALPIAAAGCALLGHRRRAVLLAVVAALTWALYFWGYTSPPNHASPLEALSNPWGALQVFLIMIGGVVPGIWVSAAMGLLLLAALGWLTWSGAWKHHAAAGLWVAFILVSCASAAAGRIGFGVFHASRYAIYSSCLLVIILLCVAAGYRVRGRAAIASTLVAAALASLGLTWERWPYAVKISHTGRALVKVDGSYLGIDHPDRDAASGILRAAEAHRFYLAPEIHPFRVRTGAEKVMPAREAGHVDEVLLAGNRLTVAGWTDVPARVRGRTLAMPSAVAPRSMSVAVVASPDVARVLSRKDLMYARYRIEASYASEEQARQAAAAVCVVVDAPGYPAAQACQVMSGSSGKIGRGTLR